MWCQLPFLDSIATGGRLTSIWLSKNKSGTFGTEEMALRKTWPDENGYIPTHTRTHTHTERDKQTQEKHMKIVGLRLPMCLTTFLAGKL